MRTACSTRRGETRGHRLAGRAGAGGTAPPGGRRGGGEGGGGEVPLAHRAVVGAEEPALGEAEDEVDAGRPERGVAPGGARADRLVVVARRPQAEGAAPAG